MTHSGTCELNNAKIERLANVSKGKFTKRLPLALFRQQPTLYPQLFFGYPVRREETAQTTNRSPDSMQHRLVRVAERDVEALKVLR